MILENIIGAAAAAKAWSQYFDFMLNGTVSRYDMSRLVGKPTMWFPNRTDTNRPVQAQKRDRSLKFWIYKVEELYYLCSENKGADQLRSYCEADLRLCCRLCRLLVFQCGGSYIPQGNISIF